MPPAARTAAAMIQFQYRSLQPTQIGDRMQLKLREMEVHQNNFANVNTTATLIAGFAFGGIAGGAPEALVESGWSHRDEARLVFWIVSMVCIAMSVYSVIIATVVNILAPDLSWRGRRGDPAPNVKRALDGLLEARAHVYAPYGFGIVLFQLIVAQIAAAVLGFDTWTEAVTSSACLAIIGGQLVYSFHATRTLRRKFSKHDPVYAQDGRSPQNSPAHSPRSRASISPPPSPGRRSISPPPSPPGSARVRRDPQFGIQHGNYTTAFGTEVFR